MNIVVNDTRSFREKVRDKLSEAKTKLKNKAGEAGRWIMDHAETILKLTPVVLAIATGTVKFIRTVRGSAADRHEDRMGKCYYDPSSGFHWELKRKLTNDERVEISRRKRDGEFTEDILKSMRVLKK